MILRAGAPFQRVKLIFLQLKKPEENQHNALDINRAKSRIACLYEAEGGLRRPRPAGSAAKPERRRATSATGGERLDEPIDEHATRGESCREGPLPSSAHPCIALEGFVERRCVGIARPSAAR
jgi:hypothetical protein